MYHDKLAAKNSWSVFVIPLSNQFNKVFIVLGWQCLLLALLVVQSIRANPILLWTFISVFIALVAWTLLLVILAKQNGTKGEGPTFELSFLARKQHYIQASVQVSVFAYWGWYWSPVYDHVWFIVAQLLFAYSFDSLLAWTRGRPYVLGFGPFPIIFSINLFLWFKSDWFYLQFVMIAVGLLGKEFIRWQRDGKSVHIFNPSAFALGLFSLLLIVTGTTDLTWGPEIASTLTLAPNIYLFLFLVGLVVMYFFSITLVAMVAATTLFGLSALHSAISGIPYFIDSEIPAAVFLGLHLLITDPSTSPRSLFGKAIFGLFYGLGVFGLYALLGLLGVPTFYDKLLCVPLLNLSVIGIDRFASLIEKKSNLFPRWTLPRLNLSFMAIWLVLFASMALLGKTDAMHQGDSVPFWQQHCAKDGGKACQRLMQIEQSYCDDGSAWACNELGIAQRQGLTGQINSSLAVSYFSRACELRFAPACQNLLQAGSSHQSEPKLLDLRLMLREGGQNLMSMDETPLLMRACEHGWSFACANSNDPKQIGAPG